MHTMDYRWVTGEFPSFFFLGEVVIFQTNLLLFGFLNCEFGIKQINKPRMLSCLSPCVRSRLTLINQQIN
jgi:hypothetical protein